MLSASLRASLLLAFAPALASECTAAEICASASDYTPTAHAGYNLLRRQRLYQLQLERARPDLHWLHRHVVQHARDVHRRWQVLALSHLRKHSTRMGGRLLPLAVHGNQSGQRLLQWGRRGGSFWRVRLHGRRDLLDGVQLHFGCAHGQRMLQRCHLHHLELQRA